jgi:hypothetical protein
MHTHSYTHVSQLEEEEEKKWNVFCTHHWRNLSVRLMAMVEFCLVHWVHDSDTVDCDYCCSLHCCVYHRYDDSIFRLRAMAMVLFSYWTLISCHRMHDLCGDRYSHLSGLAFLSWNGSVELLLLRDYVNFHFDDCLLAIPIAPSLVTLVASMPKLVSVKIKIEI